METKKDKQIKTLRKASSTKRETTQIRVLEALKIMKEKKLPITFQSVAKFAGTSKTWLYAMPEIREQIEELRNKSEVVKRTRDVYKILEKKEVELDILRKKNASYERTIKELKIQLEIAYGNLYKKSSD